MRYVLYLVFVCLFGCSVHRDVNRSLETSRTENLELDAVGIRNGNSVAENSRLFQGGYFIRGKWRIFDTSAPQLPDGSFPVLAEGSTEEQGNMEETEQERKETNAQDSSVLSVRNTAQEDTRETMSDRLGGKTETAWFKMLILGILIGIVGVVLIWWKYGKKN